MCEDLSLQDMVELREYLSDIISSRGRIRKTQLRCSMLLGEMADILGEKYISYVSRISSHVWARTMVAYQMIKEGYSTLEIGHQMMKDHSSVTYMKVKMQDALSLPQAYGDIIKIWNEFQKRIQDDIYKGTTENPVSLGGTFPDCSQQEMVKESGQICPPGDMGDLYQGNRGQAEI